ncbi:hypothetical protein T08_8721 [Trichinella sp. T8]|nr:hypothetical protein T08_8721 [Trichinella sp. T8]
MVKIALQTWFVDIAVVVRLSFFKVLIIESVKYGFFQTASSTGCVNLSIVELNTVSTKCNSTIYWPSVVVGFVVVVAVDQFDWFLVSEKNRYLLKKCDLVYLRRFQGKIAVPFREG